MEKKISFTDQALNQINKITIGGDKKFKVDSAHLKSGCCKIYKIEW